MIGPSSKQRSKSAAGAPFRGPADWPIATGPAVDGHSESRNGVLGDLRMPKRCAAARNCWPILVPRDHVLRWSLPELAGVAVTGLRTNILTCASLMRHYELRAYLARACEEYGGVPEKPIRRVFRSRGLNTNKELHSWA